MNGFFSKWKSHIIVALCGVLSALGFYGMIYLLPAYSLFAAKLLMVFVSISIFALIDLLVPGIDTIKALKEGNMAYAIFLLAVAILIAAAVGGSV